MKKDQNFALTSVTIDHFIMISVIGKGSYAKVILVRHRLNGQLYALKVVKKSKLVTPS